MVLTITFCLSTLFPSVFAQPDDLGSILEKAQESLSSQQSDENNGPSLLENNYKTCENVDYNVKLQYPEDWNFRETGYDEIIPDRVFNVRFNSPEEAEAGIVLFSVSIENLDPSSTTLNQYKDRITQNVKANLDARDMTVSDTTLDGKPAYRLEYISRIVNTESKSIDVTSVNNGRLQEVSAFGDQSTLDNYSEEIANMIQSVRFGEPKISAAIKQSDEPIKSIQESPTDETEQQNDNCDSSYPDFCIASPPPNLNCPDISQTRFTVSGSDPHGFDRDNDGMGCES